MKKIVLTLAVMLVFVMALATMTACGSTTETTAASTTEAVTTTEPNVTTQPVVTTTAPQTTKPTIPEGYTLYDNGDISFAYPEGFSKTEGGGIVSLFDLKNNNNITVLYEAKTDMYETLDNNDYVTQFMPSLESTGMTITKYNVEQIAKNANGIYVTKVTHTLSVQDMTMEQTMLITTVGSRTYTVTVTEMVNDDVFVNTVMNSLGHSK